MKLEITPIGIPNRVGHIWTHIAIGELLYNFNNKKNIGQSILGEFKGDSDFGCTINYENVSHKVIEIYIEDDILYGEIRPFQNLGNKNYRLALRTFGTLDNDMNINFCDLIAIDLLEIDFKFFRG